jgi:TonB family protein
MGISTVRDSRSGRDGIMTTAALCVVPGLGQIYNGEARKGLLFFCAGAANAIFLLLICVKGFLLSGAQAIGTSMHVRLNQAVIDCLHNIDMRSPQMLLLCILLAAFTLFCLRDAVQTRQYLKTREIYANEALAISEAASGSYIFHALMFAFMFLLVLFLFVPPDLKPQITEITFVPEQEKTTKPIQSKNRSVNSSENGGKAQPKPVINTPRKAQSPPVSSNTRQSEESQPKPKQAEQPQHKSSQTSEKISKPVSETKNTEAENRKVETKSETPPTKSVPQQVTTPKPLVPHFAPSKPVESPSPLPQPTLKTTPSAVTPTPSLQPVKTSNTSASNTAAPQPLLAMATPSQFGFTPAPTASSSAGKPGAISAPGPAPASSHRPSSSGGEPAQPGIQAVGSQHSGDSTPQPSLSSGRPTHSGPSDGGSGPVPHMVTSGGGHNRPLAVGPVIPGASNGSFDHGGPSAPAVSNERNPIGNEAAGMPDYGKYMEDLQRRIKRNWFPPRAPESKKVIVTFTIHQNGELSNVRIFHSSGDHSSDEAAVRAVEHAAPFMPLPKYSESTIDVQFTFDYNLFTGRSSGVRY